MLNVEESSVPAIGAEIDSEVRVRCLLDRSNVPRYDLHVAASDWDF